MLVSSPHHVPFVSYKNSNESQVSTRVVHLQQQSHIIKYMYSNKGRLKIAKARTHNFYTTDVTCTVRCVPFGHLNCVLELAQQVGFRDDTKFTAYSKLYVINKSLTLNCHSTLFIALWSGIGLTDLIYWSIDIHNFFPPIPN